MKREQGREFETHLNTRQDRNTFLTGGGTLTWDAGTDTLTWTAPLKIRVGAKTEYTIGTGSIGAVDATHKVVYVIIDRDTPGVVAPLVAALGDAALDADGALALGIRGADDQFYFRNGTIYVDTDVKSFGAINAATDRDDIVKAGVLLVEPVAFSYVIGTDQLAVYVGGFLQTLGVHYTETSTTSITWDASALPSSGELITFLNVAGGQGPPGTLGLGDAYAISPSIDAVPGTPVQLDSTAGGGFDALLQAGNSASTGGLAAFQVLRNGLVAANRILLRDGALDFWPIKPEPGVDDLLIHSDATGAEFGFKVAKDGSGIEFGSFPSAGPWAPQEGGGFLRWVVFTGTFTDSIGDIGGAELIPSGLDPTKVLGAVISVLDGSGNADLLNRDIAPTASELYVIMEPSGDIYIAGNVTSYTVTPVGTRYQNNAFKLVIFLSN